MNNLTHNIVIGIVGQPACGKDTLADYLVSKGLINMSHGDFLRFKMRELNMPLDRTSINAFVTEMRAKHGNAYPSEEVVKTIKSNSKPIVVSGLRNTAEINFYKREFGEDFVLFAVEAPIEVRYERLAHRQREGDTITFEVFKIQEDREKSALSGSHEVDRVIAMADFKIINNSDVGHMCDEFKKICASISKLTPIYLLM